MNNSLACKYISTGRLQNNVSFKNSEILYYEKMHKTLLILLLIFKYFILNSHRIQSNLENFITVIHFLLVRKSI